MTVVQASIIIPTVGTRSLTNGTLHSLCRQSLEAAEVLVVENGRSTGELRAYVNELAIRGMRMRYIHEPSIGLLAGRHRGVAEAQSDLLIFIDDDVELAETWLDAFMSTFEESDVALAGGPSLPKYEGPVPDWLQTFWVHTEHGASCGYLSLLDFGDQPLDIDSRYIWGLNFAIRKKVLLTVGGFHPDGFPWELRQFRGDGESAVSRSVTRLGLRSVYVPAAKVWHLVPQSRLTASYFIRRSHLQGISDSYSQIRRESGIFDEMGLKLRVPLRGRFLNKFKRLFRRTQVRLSRPDETGRAYHEGYAFHQREFCTNAAVREWVLRRTYWDYTLPAANCERGAT